MTDDERSYMLPEQPTPLVGRERAVEEAQQTLMRSDVRLLTLTGAAGIGKTRLALEVAQRSMGAFAGDVCFVDLAPLSDPEFVDSAIAQALNVRIGRGQSLSEVVRAYLQNRALLLILDNFEQVLPSAVRPSELLAACPGVKLLVTSREALRLRWEHVYPVPLLEVPEPTCRGAETATGAAVHCRSGAHPRVSAY